MAASSKVLVVGAGPVGSLAALYAAQRGYTVEVYELRNDLRDPSTTPLNFTKSINMALSERGINAMQHAGKDALLEAVYAMSLPMRGRMIHSRDRAGNLITAPQDYDVHGRTIFAVDRGGLNKCLLNMLESMPNVRFFFNHKLTGADFRRRKAWFEIGENEPTTGRCREIEVEFDFMIGADGAHSAVRHHMMKYSRMDYHQEYIDTLWCEFKLQKRNVGSLDGQNEFAISPDFLHIWPAKEFMFIAIPSTDRSFTCTLFLPAARFVDLEENPNQIPAFFDEKFPGVTDLITPDELVSSFKENPHLPLISIKCNPYHFSSSVVILGDAAHAMVPFYGQGMNSGLEDVRILFSIMDNHFGSTLHNATLGSTPVNCERLREAALVEYSQTRVPDGHAINDLALRNYIEMRAAVLSPIYKMRKRLDELLSLHFPGLGWRTKYSRVSFGNERYTDVVAISMHQDSIIGRSFALMFAGIPLAMISSLLVTRFLRNR